MIISNGGQKNNISEAVLFPFDDRSLPLRYNLETNLVNQSNDHELILERGDPEGPDGVNVKLYGTIIRVNDEYRMWYGGVSKDGTRVCYATSKDGIKWDKPSLGLTNFNGSTSNNIVRFDSEFSTQMNAILILHDPTDPDPARRFKLINEVNPFHIIAAFSPDGLTWTESPHNPVLKHNSIECGGIMKLGDSYFLNGQGGNVGTKRALVTYVSHDFNTWTDVVSVGLRRDIPPYKQIFGPHAGEQIHLGASLWNRNNVVLGLYGMWHGNSNDRKFVSVDLGFVVSNNGIHFKEPVPDFKMIKADGIRSVANNMLHPETAPCLEQGQGFENIGNETFTWYAPWRGGGIYVARWERDRLGYAQITTDHPESPHQQNDAAIDSDAPAPHIISCPIELNNSNTKVYINADGLSDDGTIRIEIIDEHFKPIPGYSGDNSISINQSGLKQLASWKNNVALDTHDHPFRIKATFEGPNSQKIRLYALYIDEDDQ